MVSFTGNTSKGPNWPPYVLFCLLFPLAFLCSLLHGPREKDLFSVCFCGGGMGFSLDLGLFTSQCLESPELVRDSTKECSREHSHSQIFLSASCRFCTPLPQHWVTNCPNLGLSSTHLSTELPSNSNTYEAHFMESSYEILSYDSQFYKVSSSATCRPISSVYLFNYFLASILAISRTFSEPIHIAFPCLTHFHIFPIHVPWHLL